MAYIALIKNRQASEFLLISAEGVTTSLKVVYSKVNEHRYLN